MKGDRLELVPAELQAIVDSMVATARDIARSGKPLAMVAQVGSLSAREVITVPLDDGTGNHDRGPNRARLLAAMMPADFVVVVSEAWVKGLPREERAKHGEIRDIPGRHDVVMFSLETPYGHWMAEARIAAHKGRTPRFFEEPVFRYVDEAEGRMVGFLPARGTMN